MKPILLALLMQPITYLPVPPKGSFKDKTAVITGGNTGLGLETARHLLKSGCKRVIIASRNSAKGEAAKKSLLETSGVNTDAVVEVWSLDLASFASTKSFAEKVNALDELDYVFLNAGLATREYMQSSDGWESTLQVNVLSTALLALLILPKLVERARRKADTQFRDYPRLVITTSSLHAIAKFTQQDAEKSLRFLNTEECFRGHPNPLEPYAFSKLFNIHTMRELAKLIPKDNAGHPQVLVSAVNPGLCKSELQREAPLKGMLKFVAFTSEYGSRNLLAAAREKTQAVYISECAATEPGGLAIGKNALKLQQKVWSEIVEELRLVAPEIEQTLRLQDAH